MSVTVPVLAEPNLGRSQRSVRLQLHWSAASGASVPTLTWINPSSSPRHLVEAQGSAALSTLTQAKIDDLLGSTNEIIASTAFGTTAMASNNTIGWVVDCGGQVDSVELCVARACVAASAAAATKLGKGTKTALTDVLAPGVDCYVTASGNLAGRINITAIASGTCTGFVQVIVNAILK